MEAKLKYLHTFKKGGQDYVFVRRWQKNCKAIKIESPIGSNDFFVEYAAAIAKQERLHGHQQLPKDNSDTLNWLITEYQNSPEWKALSKDTKKGKKGRFRYIRSAKPRGETLEFGEIDYTHIQRRHVYKLRAFAFEEGATEEKDGAPGKANNWIKDLSGLFRWAIKSGIAPDYFQNPCAGLGKLAEGPGYHTWTAEECKTFEDYWPIGTMQRLAYELLINTGARVSDAFRLGKVHEKKNTLTWKPAKTTEEHDEREEDEALEVSIPIHQNLRTAIDATPSGHLIYCATSHGTPFQSSKGFSQWFVEHKDKAGLPKQCVPHGLRKAAAKRLAEAGVGEFMLMSIMGWENPNQARVYIEKANRAKMAQKGMEMLSTEQNND